MKAHSIIKTVILLLALSAALSACGVKGAPEPPPATQQTQ